MTLLAARGLGVGIDGRMLCDGLDFELPEGARLAILGANGSGKTTLLHTLAGLRPPACGEVLLEDRPLSSFAPRQRARLVGILLQDDHEPLFATVQQVVLAGRHPHLRPFAAESAEDRAIAEGAIAATGLAGLASSRVDQLSGGERKRASLASLLAQQPRVFLLDEPNSHLDLMHQVGTLELVIDTMRQQRGCAAMVLHDVNLALRFCDHALLLTGSGPRFGPIERIVDRHSLKEVFGVDMVELHAGARRHFVPA